MGLQCLSVCYFTFCAIMTDFATLLSIDEIAVELWIKKTRFRKFSAKRGNNCRMAREGQPL